MFFFFAKQETSGKYFSPDSDSIRGEELATRWSLAGFSFIYNKCAFSPLAGFFSVVFLIYKCASPNHRCLLSVPASTPRLSFSCVSAPITRDHGFHFVQIRIRCLARSLYTRWPFTVSSWQSFSEWIPRSSLQSPFFLFWVFSASHAAFSALAIWLKLSLCASLKTGLPSSPAPPPACWAQALAGSAPAVGPDSCCCWCDARGVNNYQPEICY